MRFLWKELRTRRGRPTGCYAWHHGDVRMCGHEHDDEESHFACEDARAQMARIRAEEARSEA